MKNLKTNIYFKIGTIVLIALLLLIPTSMITGLIHEREATQKQSIFEVSSKWGNEQTIAGPYISIPYFKNGQVGLDSNEMRMTARDFIHILPTELNITGEIQPEKRYRGLYEIVVYNSKIHVKGKYSSLNLNELDIPLKNIQFDKALMTVGINDLRGIEKQINLNWGTEKFSFNPGVESKDVVTNGINAMISINPNDSLTYDFSFDIYLKGSQLLYFTPVGKVTDIKMTSTWNNPSFNGAFLPDERTTSDTGFTANWNVLHLNRNFPQIWTGYGYKISESAFGIDLLLPVDNYQKSIRSIKYAILFIGFTFLVFFFIEVMNKIFIHPIQYILVGIALIVFYTLLLSISEHIQYNIAFIISALATLFLIAGYIKAILKSSKLTYLICSILLVLYTFIFVIIQLQDYSLLFGSIGIFMILGLVMYFSRKIDWYNLNLEEKEKQEDIDNFK